MLSNCALAPYFNRLALQNDRLLKRHLYVLKSEYFSLTFVLVFHRILDFKTGLDFYLGPFFLPRRHGVSLKSCVYINTYRDRYLQNYPKKIRQSAPAPSHANPIYLFPKSSLPDHFVPDRKRPGTGILFQPNNLMLLPLEIQQSSWSTKATC